MSQTATSNSENVDVVIIGGGPTGLATGLLLQKLGVTVSIIGKSYNIFTSNSPTNTKIFQQIESLPA